MVRTSQSSTLSNSVAPVSAVPCRPNWATSAASRCSTCTRTRTRTLALALTRAHTRARTRTQTRTRLRPRPRNLTRCSTCRTPAALKAASPPSWGGSARSWCPLGSAPARPLRLLRARLAALGGSALPGRGRATGRPATASGARASRLQSRRFQRL